jgi:hypothetical protein
MFLRDHVTRGTDQSGDVLAASGLRRGGKIASAMVR